MKRILYDIVFLLGVILASVAFQSINGKEITFRFDNHPAINIIGAILGLIAIIILVRLFLLPYFIARDRNHRNKIPILLTTLFFGWSLAGWLVAIIWSTTCNTEEKPAKEKEKDHPIPKPETYQPAAYTLVEYQPKTMQLASAKKQITLPKNIRGGNMKKGWTASYHIPQEFVAIDFETANPKRTSACAFAVCVVRNGEVTERQSWLVRPEPFYFGKIESRIHGITEDDVADAPNFLDLWPEVIAYLQSNHVVAHNTSFDLSVLRSLLDFYGLAHPDFTYSCTVEMSRKAWPELKNHKLNTVAKHIGVKFNHHDAADDAYACAMIAHTLYQQEVEAA